MLGALKTLVAYLGPITSFRRRCVLSRLPPKASSIAAIGASTLANTTLLWCDAWTSLPFVPVGVYFSFRKIEKWKHTQQTRHFWKDPSDFHASCVFGKPQEKHWRRCCNSNDVWCLIWGLGQLFLPSEMPRSFLVKRGGLHCHRPTARSPSPKAAPVALDNAEEGPLSCDASLGRSCSAPSQPEVQAAGRSDKSEPCLQKPQNSN